MTISYYLRPLGLAVPRLLVPRPATWCAICGQSRWHWPGCPTLRVFDLRRGGGASTTGAALPGRDEEGTR
jgi:hypothetical protein